MVQIYSILKIHFTVLGTMEIIKYCNSGKMELQSNCL